MSPLPSGCTAIADVPGDFLAALSHANTVLGWSEFLGKDEIPPEWMWPFSDELNEWFKEVQIAREKKYNVSSDNDGDDEDYDYLENDMAKELLGL